MFDLPFDASVQGHEIDTLISYLHILMLILFVGWSSFYLFMLVRFRQSKNPKANYHGARTNASTYLELLVAVLEAILLVGFSIPIYARVAAKLPPENEAVVIRVVAQQFQWNYHYTGPDGKFGKTDFAKSDPMMGNPLGLDKSDPAAQDDIIIEGPCPNAQCVAAMHVPVGKPVIVHITSKDVVHSFGVPNLRVKLDATPGMEVPTWFIAKVPGQYNIACSQLCGDLHYAMKGLISVDKPEDYEAWLAQQLPAVQGMM